MIAERPLRRVLYGGTFDPVHTAHIEIAEAAGRLLGADRVSLIPAADPPHKSHGPHATAADRLEMVRRAVAGRPLLDVLDVEVRRGGLSYTIDTVEELLAGPCKGETLMLLVGEDALPLLPTWHRVRDLLRLVPVAVAPRSTSADQAAGGPDWDTLARALGEATVADLRSRRLATPCSPISSTEVRRRVAEGRSIRCWVPDPVADYIAERGLYGALPARRR